MAVVAFVLLSLVPSLVSSCFVAPVDAPVIDPFRPPPCPWCPGNRGLEFDTTPGRPVVAVGVGRVTFAGAVAGDLYVTVEHPGGLSSTVGRIETLEVRVGQQVSAGQRVARAGDTMILTVRRGVEYLDPAPFIGVPSWHPRLVPLDGAAARPARPATPRCAVAPVAVGAGRPSG